MMLLCGEIDNKMRKGGSMRLKKVHSTFLTAALACSLAVTPVFANPAEDAENLKNQKTEAESELSNLQTQFDTLIQNFRGRFHNPCIMTVKSAIFHKCHTYQFKFPLIQ